MVLTMRMKAPAGMTTGFLPDGVKLTADANGYVNCPKEFIGNLLSAGFTIETGEFSSIISSVAFVGNDMVFTLADLSTLTLTGAKTALKGADGANGSNGTNAYVYIAYASDDQGTDFTLTFNAALDYIAIKHTTTAISSPVVTDFAGLWKNYKGAPGGA